jgi:RNA polymerase sigma-70 factor (sigma-E family)
MTLEAARSRRTAKGEVRSSVSDAGQEFAAFFETHHRSLGRLAYLLTSDPVAADDLTGDTMLAVWRQWERIREVDEPLAYVRRMMANIAASGVRDAVRERGRLARLWRAESSTGPDPVVTVTVQAALAALPARRRACVVLRHAFDLSEQEVATIMGITVGTVKSQTAKAVKQLSTVLGTPLTEDRW